MRNKFINFLVVGIILITLTMTVTPVKMQAYIFHPFMQVLEIFGEIATACCQNIETCCYDKCTRDYDTVIEEVRDTQRFNACLKQCKHDLDVECHQS